MRQFLNGDAQAFEELESRARGACVVFAHEEMPAGATPRVARVGFEVGAGGAATLFVDRGIAYGGSDADVRQWLDSGEKRFGSFGALVTWVTGHLRDSYEPMAATGSRPATSPAGGVVAAVTNVAAVQIPSSTRSVTIDQSALVADLEERVRGQHDALRALVRGVAAHLAKETVSRPATFFAVGPSGVGKTHAGVVLSEALSAQRATERAYRFLRLDMSEYQERHRISQLIGSPQGYVGYGDGAQLTAALSSCPRTLVLFDEIEKAHPDVLRALMNAMDAGRLSTAHAEGGSHEIDCREAIFYFTSNLEADSILAEIAAADAIGSATATNAICRRRLVSAGVAREVVGRIRSFLVFRPLDPRARIEIATLSILKVAAEYGLVISQIAPSALSELLRQTGCADLGARPDEYAIDELLGEQFQQASMDPTTTDWRVIGPPLACVPHA